MPVKFLVCALFYGDYPLLARRCAFSLRALRETGRVDLRLGLNDVSPASREVIDELLAGTDRVDASPQLYKYPMMRSLLAGYEGDATHLMWFDDDSCLVPGTDAARWLDEVGAQAAATPGALGSIYANRPTDIERAWVQAQPWSTGRVEPATRLFPLGAWFVAPLALLRRFDWPPAPLRHNGGDSAFGALLFQQGLPAVPFRTGVVINADDSLAEGSAPRRGYSERPLGI